MYPEFRAGQKLRAADLLSMGTYEVQQASDLTRTSTTTFADTNIVIPGEANAIYEYRLTAVYSGGTTGLAKFEWEVPSGTTMQRHGIGIGATSTGSQTNADILFSAQGSESTDFNVGVNSSSSVSQCSFYETGRIEMGTTEGDVTLQFGQVASSATSSVLYSTTACVYQRIG